MALEKFTKDPDAILDYMIDWSAWLVDDKISVSTWVADTGLTVDSDTFTNSTTTVWLSGGTALSRYEIINHITTEAGREDDRTIIIVCKDK